MLVEMVVLEEVVETINLVALVTLQVHPQVKVKMVGLVQQVLHLMLQQVVAVLVVLEEVLVHLQVVEQEEMVYLLQ